MEANVKDQVCPTCGKLLPIAHLVQLNHTLGQLLGAEAIPVGDVTAMIKSTVAEIEAVSKVMRCVPTVQFGRPGETIPLKP
jgi:hypothetical protein